MASIYDWSTTAASNSNSDSGINWAEGQAPSTVNNSSRQEMGRVREFVTDLGGSIAAGGTANGLTVTASSAFTALVDGLIVSFRATASNTTAATLNVNGIAAKAIQKMGQSGDIALAANDIRNTGIYIVQYSAALNGAAGAWLLINPTPATPTVTPPSAQVFSGSGTWTKPTGCTRIVIEAVGGGGAGGNVDGQGASTAGTGGGGGAGFHGETGFLDVSAVVSAAVTIGAAGAIAGGTSADGGSGGSTSITIGATTYTCGGGGGGGGMVAGGTIGGSQDGGAGGTGTNVVGGANIGSVGVYNGNGATNTTSGAGASSPFGTGGRSRHQTSATASNGLDAVGYGAGGSGGATNNTASNAVGGAGVGGYMRIWEYYS